ncbi:MAG TPA: hypothetical protein VN903_09730 [Polyangia bacterium]|nr:hypothetical protein [Polyangia bacterium]
MTDEERTIALIAGNILTGRMPFGGGGPDADLQAVAWAVSLARLIVEEARAPEAGPS